MCVIFEHEMLNFKNQNSKRYLISLAVTVTAVALQYGIIFGAKISVPGILYPATFVIASLYGLGPALLAIGLGSVLADIFFYEPRFVLKILARDDFIRVGTYVVASTVASIIMAKAQAAQLEKLRAVAALKDFEDRFKRAASAIDLGVWYSDLPTEKMIWNSEVKNHFWLSEDAPITNEIFFQQIHPDDRARIKDAISTSIDNHVMFDEVFRTVNPEDPGEQKHIRSIGWADYDSNNTPLRFDGITLDNSQIRLISAERDFSLEQAKRAVQVRDEFLSISSHELKTPLTPLKMQLEIISNHVIKGTLQSLSGERLQRMIFNAQKQVSRLTTLIDDLLDVSRISAGKLTLNFEDVDVAECIREVIERYQPALTAARCETRYLGPPSHMAKLDRIRFEQVLINFLTNAIKYASAQPIDVILTVSANAFTLAVKDHGMGISIEDQERIFERYERVLSAATYGGLGLGLFIVNQIVNAHGGTISVKSAPEQGSTFSVTLPNKRRTV